MEEFKYLGVLFMSKGRMEQEIHRRIGAASAVMRTLHGSVVVKRELMRGAVERSQMRWLGHLVMMPPGRLSGEVWRSSSTSGSCSRVRGGWSGRSTGGSVQRLQ